MKKCQTRQWTHIQKLKAPAISHGIEMLFGNAGSESKILLPYPLAAFLTWKIFIHVLKCPILAFSSSLLHGISPFRKSYSTFLW